MDKCVILYRKKGTYGDVKTSDYLIVMANALANTLKLLGVSNKTITINWMYMYKGQEKRERMGYYLFLLEGIGIDELWLLYDKNWIKTNPMSGEIIPMYSVGGDYFTRFVRKIKVVKL